MKKECLKSTKIIKPVVISKMKEGYSLRKAISITGLTKKK